MSRYTPEELALLKDDGNMDVDGQGRDGGPPGNATPTVPPGSVPTSQRERSGSTASTSDDITLPRAYFNVRAARAAISTVRTLGEGAVISAQSTVGSFIVLNDSRVMRANHWHCYGKKATSQHHLIWKN
jgi:hypothetical protein